MSLGRRSCRGRRIQARLDEGVLPPNHHRKRSAETLDCQDNQNDTIRNESYADGYYSEVSASGSNSTISSAKKRRRILVCRNPVAGFVALNKALESTILPNIGHLLPKTSLPLIRSHNSSTNHELSLYSNGVGQGYPSLSASPIKNPDRFLPVISSCNVNSEEGKRPEFPYSGFKRISSPSLTITSDYSSIPRPSNLSVSSACDSGVFKLPPKPSMKKVSSSTKVQSSSSTASYYSGSESLLSKSLSSRNNEDLISMVAKLKSQGMSVYSLTKWCPALRNGRKFVIEGDLLDDNHSTPRTFQDRWATSKVLGRHSSKILITKLRYYVLHGPLDDNEADKNGTPTFIRDAFENGLPENWEDCVKRWRNQVIDGGMSTVSSMVSGFASRKRPKIILTPLEHHPELSKFMSGCITSHSGSRANNQEDKVQDSTDSALVGQRCEKYDEGDEMQLRSSIQTTEKSRKSKASKKIEVEDEGLNRVFKSPTRVSARIRNMPKRCYKDSWEIDCVNSPRKKPETQQKSSSKMQTNTRQKKSTTSNSTSPVKRGRPRKLTNDISTLSRPTVITCDNVGQAKCPVKRGRGRPKKISSPLRAPQRKSQKSSHGATVRDPDIQAEISVDRVSCHPHQTHYKPSDSQVRTRNHGSPETSETVLVKKRGRPRKSKIPQEKTGDAKKRGRPRKNLVAQESSSSTIAAEMNKESIHSADDPLEVQDVQSKKRCVQSKSSIENPDKNNKIESAMSVKSRKGTKNQRQLREEEPVPSSKRNGRSITVPKVVGKTQPAKDSSVQEHADDMFCARNSKQNERKRHSYTNTSANAATKNPKEIVNDLFDSDSENDFSVHSARTPIGNYVRSSLDKSSHSSLTKGDTPERHTIGFKERAYIKRQVRESKRAQTVLVSKLKIGSTGRASCNNKIGTKRPLTPTFSKPVKKFVQEREKTDDEESEHYEEDYFSDVEEDD